jgi:hypothetical protein
MQKLKKTAQDKWQRQRNYEVVGSKIDSVSSTMPRVKVLPKLVPNNSTWRPRHSIDNYGPNPTHTKQQAARKVPLHSLPFFSGLSSICTTILARVFWTVLDLPPATSHLRVAHL